LLCMTIASFFLALADEFRKLLNEVSNLCRTGIGEHGADHADDSRGKGVRVVVGLGRTVQQELLGGRGSFSRLRCSLCRVDDFFSGGVEFGVSGTVSSRGVSATRDRVAGGRDMGGVAFQGHWVSHSSGGGVVLAVRVVAEAGMLEGVLTFGTMDKGLR